MMRVAGSDEWSDGNALDGDGACDDEYGANDGYYEHGHGDGGGNLAPGLQLACNRYTT